MPGKGNSAAGSRRHGALRQEKRQTHNRREPPPKNAVFEAYYTAQGVVPPASWVDFLESLQRPAPVVVRLNRTKPRWEALEDSFRADPRWTQLPWAPGTWKCEGHDYDDSLQRQIVALNKAYALRIQEAASLVPPLLLGLKPDDVVMDMCSAPGSKTLECLELMRADASYSDAGVMVANDADAERAFELLPIITRKAHHTGTIVTLANAAKFPPLMECPDACLLDNTQDLKAEGLQQMPEPLDPTCPQQEQQEQQPTQQQLLFDRIVCDVPCSGDGTLRKHPHAWASWSVRHGLGFHTKQLRLLCRGLHLLRPGGRLVYSTCSLNPLENEAVVAAALRRFGGDVALVPDAAAGLAAQGLVVAEGLSHWGVPNPSSSEGVQMFDSWSDTSEALRHPVGMLSETMFSARTAENSAGDILSMLPRGCIRLNPQSIDGSGFFVAVFQKIEHRCVPMEYPCPGEPVPFNSRRLAWRARNEANHYEIMDPSSDVVQEMLGFYGIQSVPGVLVAEFNTKGRLMQLNLINEALRRFLRCRRLSKASPLLISVGVPLFKPLPDGFMTEIQLPSRWRPALEGAELLAPLMQRRVLRLSGRALDALLAHRLLPMAELPALATAGDLDGLESCGGLLGGAVVGLRDGGFWAPCVVTGQGLELFANAEELGTPFPALLPPQGFRILQEGHNYVVVEKPSGLRTEEVLDRVRTAHPEAELVSRLDRETSGCLLIPTTQLCAATLTLQFSRHEVRKTYLALVGGSPPARGTIEAPLSLVESGGGARYRAYVDAEHGKAAETRFQTLWAGNDTALIWAEPVTGRTHQIRCHFAHAGFPLLGDPKYGNRAAVQEHIPRLALHCLQVKAHDELGAPIEATSWLLDDFKVLLDSSALEALVRHCQLENVSAYPVKSGEVL